MCGIAGIFRFRTGRPVHPAELSRMSAAVAHRGPDGEGRYIDGCLGLAHRRLSVIDVAVRSNQPMSSADGELHISFNGEIYNYLELRAELIAQGETFRTESDTEVLLCMYRRYGPKCLERLNGMFAFAIWNAADRSLFLARDHVGIKPLYYCEDREGLVFGSEVKSILMVGGLRREADTGLLDAYMRFGFVPGASTMFRGIRRLEPGRYLLARDGRIETGQYWDLRYEDAPDRGEAHYLEEAAELLADATRLQLRSDVPLGVFLSGGVDSSAIVAMMHEAGARDVKTYSIAWDHGSEFNESSYARRVSGQFATDHHEHWMKTSDFQGSLEHYTWHMDEPVAEAAAVSLYHIARMARRSVTVALSGEGSDEVFGGYPIYLYMQWVDRYRRLPRGLRHLALDPLFSLLGAKARKYIDLSRHPVEERYMGVAFYDGSASLYSAEMATLPRERPAATAAAGYYAACGSTDLQRRMQYLDVKTWLVDDLLIKADRMTMASSLELRVPFLDHRLLEFAARLPSRYRLKGGTPKYLIKKAMEPYLPKDIIYRTKRGFPTPLGNLFRNGMRDYLTDLLDSQRFHQRGLFDPFAVRKLLGEHFAGTADHHKRIWQLAALENWYLTFIDPPTLLAAGARAAEAG